MSDLINRQDAIKAIEDLPNCYNGFSDTYDKACIIGALEELPSAVLRCKDCKYGKQDEEDRWFCSDLSCVMGDEDGNEFCSDAERR